MLASHCAECGSTGRPVIGVFQTLSAGNAGQLVRGNTGPFPPVGAATATTGAAIAADAARTHARIRINLYRILTRDPEMARRGGRHVSDATDRPALLTGARYVSALRVD